MNAARPSAARAHPYSSAAAANECAELLRLNGWKRVRVEEVLK